jgi:hypothetical protein
MPEQVSGTWRTVSALLMWSCSPLQLPDLSCFGKCQALSYLWALDPATCSA